MCGTPGRLEDLISTGKLVLHQVRFFVLDECVSILTRHFLLVFPSHHFAYCSSYQDEGSTVGKIMLSCLDGFLSLGF